jgi:hypothetical protein
MWRWARRWADWVRNDLLALARARRGGVAVSVGYEAAGRTHAALPVPWTADAVTADFLLRIPPAARRKADFDLRFPLAAPVAAESVRADGDHYRVTFRFPVPRGTTTGELLWRQRPVAQVTVPVLVAPTFLAGLSLVNPTLAVRLGGQLPAVRAFVPCGCRGLLASAVLRSPHRLSPAADLGVTAEFRSERVGRSFLVPVPLSEAQRGSTEAVVTAACPRVPRRPGVWSVVWRVGDHVLAADRTEAIPPDRFEEGVRLLDTRFAVADRAGPPRFLRLPPVPGTFERIGPCFLVAAGQPGAAGLCRLSVFTVTPGNPLATLLLEQEVLVTDAPTVFAPGLLDAANLARVGAFELRLNGRVLGAAALCPVPPATLTAEGGFKPPRDFAWTAAAEEELIERLGRLGGS